VYCLKFPFLRTVKYYNFVPYNLSLYNYRPEKSQCYPEKEKFCPEKEECGPEKEPVVKEEEEYCRYCFFCRGVQNISVPASVTPKKKSFALKRKNVALKKSLLWRRGRRVLLLLLLLLSCSKYFCNSQCYPKKEKFCPEKEECGPEKEPLVEKRKKSTAAPASSAVVFKIFL
jgi:hypothetical protein